MSNWSNLGRDSQRTSADPSGDVTSVAEIWSRKGGTDNRNGWSGGVITDSDSAYYFYSSYYPNIGGTGDRFSLNRYDLNGNLKWANNTALGDHNDLGTWPSTGAKVVINTGAQADVIIYHDYSFGTVDKYTGAKDGASWQGADSYGNRVFNPAKTKMFACRTFWNEGFAGRGWVRAYDLTVYNNPLNSAMLWARSVMSDTDNAVDDPSYTGVGGNMVYDNGYVFHAPKYAGSPALFHTGIYCWDEAGVEQWNVTTTPQSRMSAGNGLLYMMESATGHNVAGKSLVARSQTTGAIVWSTVITGFSITGQPPVVVNSLVIMPSSTGVHARNATTGAVVWDAAITDIDFPTDVNQRPLYTVLAAAITSNTLVACSKNGLYILSLVDGSTVQFYNPPSVTGRPLNPIVDGNRIYITDGTDTYNPSGPQTIVALENGITPPPSDVIPPSAPGNPAFSSVTTSSMIVSWTASTDAIGVIYYNVFYRPSGGTWSSITRSTTSFNFTGLASSTTYEFYVNAVDAAGNVSSNSATTSQATSAVVVDSTPPSAPGSPTFTNVSYTSMTVSWTGSTDDVALAYYRLYWRQAGGTWNTINKTSTSNNFTGLTSGITYEFYVNAVDTSGNSSTDSATTTQTTLVVVADTTPPTTPGSPTFSSVTTTGMTVSWTASTDSSGVSSYTLFYRQLNGVWTAISTSSTSRVFTGLAPSTTYEFYVNSVDIYGNVSANSATTSQITDTLPATFTQISGTTSITTATRQRTTHNLNWQNVVGTMELQRRTGKTSYVTIYTGDAPYSYIQSDLNTNYYYRILVNGTTPSNEIILMSKRK